MFEKISYTHLKMLEDIKNKKTKYVSCIKIKGIPILPPLITNIKHREIQKYKQEAIKLEKYLKTQQELKTFSKSNVPKIGHIITNSLEHILAFEDNLNSDIEEISETCLSKREVASVVRKIPQLCCDLQVSQYTNNEFTVLTDFEKCKPQTDIIDKPTSNGDEHLSKESSFETEIDISDIDNQKHRLIRSNSYILESPSPMLLEHLRKQSKFSENELYEHLWQNECATSGDIRNHNLNDKILLPSDNKTYPNHDDISLTDISNFDVSKSESELKNLSPLSNPNSENKITIVENQYDIKEFIDNNVPEMINNHLFSNNSVPRNEVESPKESLDAIPNTCFNQLQHYSYYEKETLMKVLNNIPEIYTKQILELLEKQEQLSKLDTSTNSNRSSVDHHELSNEQILLNGSYHHNRSNNLSNFDITNYKQCSSTSVIYDEESKFSGKNNDLPRSLNKTENELILSCSRELFPSICDKNVKRLLSEEHAASIIGAAARGYLVRRIMRTEHVQSLMQTIRDVLICAMQLHTEHIDSIKESDVELHRRLIQQVSAACFEFHDIFFSLSTSEQMNLIRQDREKRKEKLKQPFSRVSSAGKSSRSSNKSSTNLR